MITSLSAMIASVCLVAVFGDQATSRTAENGSAAARPRGGDLPLPVIPRGFGVNIHFTRPIPGEMERLAEARFRLARMDFKWDLVEKKAGTYEFAPYDGLVEHLARAGIRPLFILDYGHPRYDGGRAPRTAAVRAAFARMAAAAATHFRGRGVLWEIWNEPNLAHFWKPDPEAAAYASLALETAKAIRAAVPEATILAPASSQFPWPFFEEVFRAGLLDQVDAVSVHPYRNSPPESVLSDYGRLRALVARHTTPARRNLPIVCSEWGYSTPRGGLSETNQAHYLVRTWLTSLAAGAQLSIFYDWRDDGDDPNEPEHHFGTVRRDLTPKPAFTAAKSLIAALDGFSLRQCLGGARASSDWQLLFQRGDTADLALVTWSADPRGSNSRQEPVVRRIGPGDRDFAATLRLSSIRYPLGAWAEGQGQEAAVDIEFFNPEEHPARVGIALGDQKRARMDVTLAPGKRERQTLKLPTPRLRAETRSVPIRLTWNGEILPPVRPLELWRTDPLMLSAAPRGGELEITIDNAARAPFAGRLVVSSGGREAASASVSMSDDEGRRVVRLAGPSGWHEVCLLAGDRAPLARIGRRRYEALAGFPARPSAATGYSSVLFVDNASRPPEPLAAVAAPTGGPASVALSFPYRFERGHRFALVASNREVSIPGEARAMIVWLHGDGGNDYLRSRLRDSTGQVFQVDLGQLGRSGWRPVTIPLDGSGIGAHWGGRGDGVIHPPSVWEGLILIDSAHRDSAHSGEALLAAPAYVFGE